jgi:hypothetical protein
MTGLMSLVSIMRSSATHRVATLWISRSNGSLWLFRPTRRASAAWAIDQANRHVMTVNSQPTSHYLGIPDGKGKMLNRGTIFSLTVEPMAFHRCMILSRCRDSLTHSIPTVQPAVNHIILVMAQRLPTHFFDLPDSIYEEVMLISHTIHLPSRLNKVLVSSR